MDSENIEYLLKTIAVLFRYQTVRYYKNIANGFPVNSYFKLTKLF